MKTSTIQKSQIESKDDFFFAADLNVKYFFVNFFQKKKFDAFSQSK